MIEFTLPNFYENQDYYNLLIQFIEQTYHYTKTEGFAQKQRVIISKLSGNFPFSFWGGAVNNNYKPSNVVTWNKAFDYAENLRLPIMLDFSNIALNNKDFKDNHVKMVLAAFDNRLNYIRVSNFNVINNIKKISNYYKFVLSSDVEYMAPAPYETLATLEDFEEIELPSNLNKERLKALPNKSKFMYPLGDRCRGCEGYRDCLRQEYSNQYNFSTISNFITCDYFKPFTIAEDFVEGYKLGFRKFYFVNVCHKDQDKINAQLPYLIFTPEYIEKFKQYLQENSND